MGVSKFTQHPGKVARHCYASLQREKPDHSLTFSQGRMDNEWHGLLSGEAHTLLLESANNFTFMGSVHGLYTGPNT